MKMRGTGEENTKKSVPNFARGLPILLVDHDTSSLASVSSMLQHYTFNVTMARSTAAAMSMVRDEKGRFKLVMAHLNLAKIEHVSFLRALVKEGLPVILISSCNNVNNAEKALAEGACFFLEKPIALSDLKYVWQHACQRRTVNNPAGEERRAGVKGKRKHSEVPPPINSNDNDRTQTIPRGKDKQIGVAAVGSRSKSVPERSVDGPEGGRPEPSRPHDAVKRPLDDGNGCGTAMPSKKLNTGGAERVSLGKESVIEKAMEAGENGGAAMEKEKKSRIVWTSELHRKFIAALSVLGDHCARPKSILQMMNVPSLTQRQVASHLQKYKAQVRQITQIGTASSPSSTTQMESFTRSGTFGMEGFGFQSGSNSNPYLPPSDPYGIGKYDNFLYYGDLQRTSGFVKPMEPSDPNHTPSSHENSASESICGGSNSVTRDASEKQCASEAGGTRIQCPDSDWQNMSSPLEVEGDMDYFSDLASILSSDQLPADFVMDLGLQYELSEMNTEQLPTLSAINSTQNVPEYLSNIASAMSPLQEAMVQNDTSAETSEGYLMNSSSSTNSDGFLMALKDDNPVENTAGADNDELLKMLQVEPQDFADLEGKLNFDNVNQYSEWLEELLRTPDEAESNFHPVHPSKM